MFSIHAGEAYKLRSVRCGGVPNTLRRATSCWEVCLSWRATAYVKTLTKHPDGSALTAREKLLLFVLADYHNDDKGYSWASLGSIARDALTSRRHIITLIDELETKGTLGVLRREQKTSLYYFPLMGGELASLGGAKSIRCGEAIGSLGGEVASAPEPSRTDSKEEPTALDARQIIFAIEESQRTGKNADEILRGLRGAQRP